MPHSREVVGLQLHAVTHWPAGSRRIRRSERDPRSPAGLHVMRHAVRDHIRLSKIRARIVSNSSKNEIKYLTVRRTMKVRLQRPPSASRRTPENRISAVLHSSDHSVGRLRSVLGVGQNDGNKLRCSSLICGLASPRTRHPRKPGLAHLFEASSGCRPSRRREAPSRSPEASSKATRPPQPRRASTFSLCLLPCQRASLAPRGLRSRAALLKSAVREPLPPRLSRLGTHAEPDGSGSSFFCSPRTSSLCFEAAEYAHG
jgi:hypothetical protein